MIGKSIDLIRSDLRNRHLKNHKYFLKVRIKYRELIVKGRKAHEEQLGKYWAKKLDS